MSDTLQDKIRNLERQLVEVTAQVNTLQSDFVNRMTSGEDVSGGPTGRSQLPLCKPDSFSEDKSTEAEPPFSIFYEYDGESGSRSKGFYIYVPRGCLLVGDTEVKFLDSEGDCVRIDDLEDDDSVQTVYAHVAETEADSGEYEAKFTCDVNRPEEFKDDSSESGEGEGEEGEEAKREYYRFKVGVFDGTYVRLCSSVVSLGGSGGGGGGIARWVDPDESYYS